jgi:hypothetical protein
MIDKAFSFSVQFPDVSLGVLFLCFSFHIPLIELRADTMLDLQILHFLFNLILSTLVLLYLQMVSQ